MDEIQRDAALDDLAEAFSKQYKLINQTIECMNGDNYKSWFTQIENNIEKLRTAIESSELESKLRESMYPFFDQLVINLIDSYLKFDNK